MSIRGSDISVEQQLLMEETSSSKISPKKLSKQNSSRKNLNRSPVKRKITKTVGLSLAELRNDK